MDAVLAAACKTPLRKNGTLAPDIAGQMNRSAPQLGETPTVLPTRTIEKKLLIREAETSDLSEEGLFICIFGVHWLTITTQPFGSSQTVLVCKCARCILASGDMRAAGAMRLASQLGSVYAS